MTEHDTDDAVVRTVTVQAPRTRVWAAVSDIAEFSAWFGGEDMRIEGTIAPGAALTSRFGDGPPEPFCTIESLEPERTLVFHWVPYEPPPGVEATHLTRVEISLIDVDGGTRVTITESGFAALPAQFRERAARNGDGWGIAVQSLAQHLIGAVVVSVRTPLRATVARARALLLARAGCADPGSGSVVHLAFDGGELVDCDVGYANDTLLMMVWRVGALTKVTFAFANDGAGCVLTISEAPFCLEKESVQRALAQTERWTRFGLRLAQALEGANVT